MKKYVLYRSNLFIRRKIVQQAGPEKQINLFNNKKIYRKNIQYLILNVFLKEITGIVRKTNTSYSYMCYKLLIFFINTNDH